MMKKDTRVIYAVALLRTIASAISGFAIEVFVRLSGASDIAISLVAAIPSITYMIAAIFLSGQADRLGRRVVLLISSGVSFLATVIYIGLFIAVANLAVMIIMVILVEAIEGVFAGWFWPVLQAKLGEGTKENGPQIRIYNFSWNLGVILGNALVAGYASISIDLRVLFPIVLQVLAGGFVINGIIFGLLWKKFEIAPAIVAVSPYISRKVEVTGKFPKQVPVSIGIAFVAIFAFAVNVGGILTNIFNQITTVSGNAIVAVNLLPWIPIIDTTRQMAQLTTSGTYKVAKPALKDVTHIITLMSVIALLSGGASTLLTKGGIIVIAFVLGIHGLLSGVLYNATMQIILHDAPANQRGRFQGLYEAVTGLGFFVGPIMAGIVSEFKGYPTSYNVLAGFSFVAAGILASMQLQGVQRGHRIGTGTFMVKAPRIPMAIKVPLALAGIWLGFGILGITGAFSTLTGISLVLGITAFSTAVLLKVRPDTIHVFDRLISQRPHVVAACMPNSEFAYYALTSDPLEVFPLVPL